MGDFDGDACQLGAAAGHHEHDDNSSRGDDNGAEGLQRSTRQGEMERTDWLDERLTPGDARFLMVTAITHHRVSSPTWGEHEVRKLHAELAGIQRLAVRVVAEESATFSSRRPFERRGTEPNSGKAA